MNTLIKRIIIGVTGLAALAGGVVYAVYPDGVDIEQVKRQDIVANINVLGTIEADEIITVYAPVAGRLDKVSFKVNDRVKNGDVLASYDLTSLEEEYKKASLNTEYHEDGYNAAVTENDKNKAKAASASRSSESLKQQYIAVEENRDDLSIAQNSKSNYIQSTMSGIEGALDNMKTDMEVESAKLESASGAYNELYAKLLEAKANISGQNSQIESLNSQIKANAAAYEAIKDDPEKASEAEELLSANQELSEGLAEVMSENTKSAAEYNSLREALHSAEDKKDSAASSVNSIKDNIASSRDALASLPVDNMTTEQYALFLELSRQLDIIEKEWTRANEQKTAAEEKIVNDYQIKQLEDSMELAQIDADKALGNLTKGKEGVKSSTSGTIIEKMANEGAVVDAGTALFTIQPDSGYKASVMISKYDIGRVKLGQKASVSVSGVSYEGTVSSIAPIATNDSTGKPRVKVEISFDEKDAHPTIGLEAEVLINSGESKEAITVPEKAVYTDDEGSYVYMLENGRAEKRSIVTGLKGSGCYQVVDGLNDGEKVITSPVTEDDIGTRFVEN